MKNVDFIIKQIADSKESDPLSTVSSDLVWKLMTPKMAWSGARVTVGRRHDEERETQALCLNAANQCGEDVFMAEGTSGEIELILDADNPTAQW